MTDVDRSALDGQAEQFEQLGIGFADEAGIAARESAEPQAMYVERAAQCPVVRSEGGIVSSSGFV